MITEVEIRNVRLFGEKGVKVSLPELSVLCGTNSSGKSTILKCLLFLRQSLEGIRFVGSDVDLGNYSSFVFHGEKNRDITIGLTIEYFISNKTIDFLRSIGMQDRTALDYNDDESDPNNENYSQYKLRSVFTFSFTQDHFGLEDQISLFEPSKNGKDGETIPPSVILKSTHYEIIVDEKVLLSWKILLSDERSKKKPNYEIFLPKEYFEALDGPKHMHLEMSEDRNFYKARAAITGILPNGLMVKRHIPETDRTPEQPKSRQLDWFPLPPTIVEIQNDLSTVLKEIEHLGPLRTPAKRYYLTTFDFVPSSDPEGEFLPYILRHKSSTTVSNCRPGCKDEIEEHLSVALNGWLYYFRTGESLNTQVYDELSVSAVEDVIVKFHIKTVGGTQLHSLADSGFGYSQVLPILVKGLLLDVRGSLIVEQPELHLNPSLHVRLAAFFVAMARIGKQIIIETHSEHIVNAIRVFSAEDESGDLSSSCAVFFIDFKEKEPIIHELSIRPDGVVPEWPHNFFGEAASLTGRLLRAQKRFRK